ncbi:MAG: iron-sulfur cluster assembly scaffold protein [Nanoarchaeota archaeon]
MNDNTGVDEDKTGNQSPPAEDSFPDGVPFENRLMYTEILLDYYRNPRCFGTIENYHVHARDTNPSCGDVIEFFARVNRDKVITEIKFTGKGCAISQAAASMLAEAMMGKNINEIVKLDKKQMLEMVGIPISMMRMKCALLGMKVLKVGVYQYLGKEMEEGD